MQNHIQYLIGKKIAFQHLNKESKTLFLYIAPQDDNERKKFFDIILKPQLMIVSDYKLLNKDELVWTILTTNFPIDTVLDIFISTIDSLTPFELNKSLNEHIKEHKIAFEY